MSIYDAARRKPNYFRQEIIPRRWNINSNWNIWSTRFKLTFFSQLAINSIWHNSYQRSAPTVYPSACTFILSTFFVFCEPLKLTMAPLRQSCIRACLFAFSSLWFGAKQRSQTVPYVAWNCMCMLKWSWRMDFIQWSTWSTIWLAKQSAGPPLSISRSLSCIYSEVTVLPPYHHIFSSSPTKRMG